MKSPLPLSNKSPDQSSPSHSCTSTSVPAHSLDIHTSLRYWIANNSYSTYHIFVSHFMFSHLQGELHFINQLAIHEVLLAIHPFILKGRIFTRLRCFIKWQSFVGRIVWVLEPMRRILISKTLNSCQMWVRSSGSSSHCHRIRIRFIPPMWWRIILGLNIFHICKALELIGTQTLSGLHFRHFYFWSNQHITFIWEDW